MRRKGLRRVVAGACDGHQHANCLRGTLLLYKLRVGAVASIYGRVICMVIEINVFGNEVDTRDVSRRLSRACDRV